MRKLFLWLFIPFLLFAEENYTGVGDTASITSILVDGTKQYTTIFNMRGEDLWVLIFVNDTAEALFGNDSINFEWGIQLGFWCFDSARALDTLWGDHIVMDTIEQDSLGKSNNARMSPSGDVTYALRGVDSSNTVTGYCYQQRKIEIEDVWAPLFRGWVHSLGDPNADENALDIRFQFIQKAYNPVRRK